MKKSTRNPRSSKPLKTQADAALEARAKRILDVAAAVSPFGKATPISTAAACTAAVCEVLVNIALNIGARDQGGDR